MYHNPINDSYALTILCLVNTYISKYLLTQRVTSDQLLKDVGQDDSGVEL